MLSTINGFDLLLVIVIVLLVFKVMRLNDECNDYVEQILRLSWNLQAEIRDNVMWEARSNPSECVYCIGIEEMITGNECYCASF